MSQHAAIGTGVTESVFATDGMRTVVDRLVHEAAKLYLCDDVPWIVGYSGGKDSTAILQIVWTALTTIEPARRTKPVHVITNDTLVENPIVSGWVRTSQTRINEAAAEQGLPVQAHLLIPEIGETFWVNLIGRGYPAPTRRFRWCTERMKINPATRFIRETVRSNGETIIVLGARRAESAARARRIDQQAASEVRENLSPHPDLASALVYKPIVDWTNDDVWSYLMQNKNPWGHDNKKLMTMYRSASADAECPLVIDTSTASCGNSRFGCWTCTVVEKDKSMAAMISNDAEREWMQPLLDLRNELADSERSREVRDWRRLNGKVSLFNGEVVPGPYTQEARADWLRKLLEAQAWVRANGPKETAEIELVAMEELHEIRRIWVEDKHEREDLLPAIYEAALGEPYPTGPFDEQFPFDNDDLATLREVAGSDLQYELLRNLLGVEHSYRSEVRRVGLLDSMERQFDRSGWESPAEAVDHHKALARGRQPRDGDDAARVTFETLLLDIDIDRDGEAYA
jgi:DNA sulfur modification protein DndC